MEVWWLWETEIHLDPDHRHRRNQTETLSKSAKCFALIKSFVVLNSSKNLGKGSWVPWDLTSSPQHPA